MKKTKKENRGGARANTGGARAGAGRKKKENKADIRIMFRLNEEEYNLIKEEADKLNLSVGQYARETTLKKVSKK